MRALLLALPLALSLGACTDKGGGDTGGGGADGDGGGDDGGGMPTIEVTSVGPAAWDGFILTAEDGEAHVPMVRDADGNEVEVVETSNEAFTLSWWSGPDGTLPPGEYTVYGIDGVDVGYTETFTVAEYGQVDGFDAAVLEDGAYEVDLASVWPFGELLDALADDDRLVLVLDSTSATWADARVIYEQGSGACFAQNVSGDMDAVGIMSWQADRLEVSMKPELLALTPKWKLGFSPDGQTFAGLEGVAEVDLRTVSAWVTEAGDEEALCRGWEAFGGTCEDCGDGTMGCATVGFRGGEGVAISRPEYSEPPPECGLLLQEDAIPDMDVDCSCSTGLGGAVGGAWLAGLVAFWRRRRD